MPGEQGGHAPEEDFQKWEAELETNPDIAVAAAALGHEPNSTTEQTDAQIDRANVARDKIQTAYSGEADQPNTQTNPPTPAERERAANEAYVARRDRALANNQAKEQRWDERIGKSKGLAKLALKAARQLDTTFGIRDRNLR